MDARVVAAPQLFTRSGAAIARDIVVIGASAGGIAPLREVLSRLEARIAAAFFVVVHHGGAESRLASVLDQSGPLRTLDAEDGMPIEHGSVYVAPADRHLLVAEGEIRVVRGPKENRTRPAIDPLFRSAAWTYGPRVVGVLLSGLLDDGAAGLWAIRTCGGMLIVQDPDSARFPEMPKHALRSVDPDYCVPPAAMPELIAALAAPSPAPRTPRGARRSRAASASAAPAASNGFHTAVLSPYTCPSCDGALWEINDGLRLRAPAGSGAVLDSRDADSEEAIRNKNLAAALRTLDESAAMLHRLARRARETQNQRMAARYDERTRQASAGAEALRSILESANGSRAGTRQTKARKRSAKAPARRGR